MFTIRRCSYKFKDHKINFIDIDELNALRFQFVLEMSTLVIFFKFNQQCPFSLQITLSPSKENRTDKEKSLIYIDMFTYKAHTNSKLLV